MVGALHKKATKQGATPPRPPRREASRGGNSADKETRRNARKKRFMLLIGDEGAILVFMQGSKVVRRLFAPSAQPAHSEAMVEIMRANPSVPLTLLVDVIDQQYVLQTFPPVSALSVGGLVKRRLDRDFQPDDLTGALRLGRDKTGRKEWKYLLVGLAKTPLIAEWLDVVLDLPNEMKGIYLVPIEAVHYVAMLGRKLSHDKARPWQLLISHNKVSGFRQVVMHDGKLIFTRVSQAMDDAIPAVIAGNVEQEIINTIEYLKRLEFHDNAELDATIIISQDVIDSLDLRRFNFGRATALSPLSVAEALGFEQAALSADRFGDVVLAAAFGVSRKRLLRFSNAYIDKLTKLYQARIGLQVFAGLMALIFLGLTAGTLATTIENATSIAQIKTRQAALQPNLEKMRRSVDGLNSDVAFKSVFVATYDAYLKNHPRPEDSITAIAALMSPQRRVLDIAWDISSANMPSPGAGGNALPLAIKLSVDFSPAGATVDVVEAEANNLLEAMKTDLRQYEVMAEAFPWRRDEVQSEKISLDQSTQKLSAVQNAVVVFHLKGLKPLPAAAPVAGQGAR
ncbi:MAG: hypothetical protein SFW64_02870 [Alphaproteobacteria bacterium]|nr:hypothetical protein [Alphaproteobacteria bacterium]